MKRPLAEAWRYLFINPATIAKKSNNILILKASTSLLTLGRKFAKKNVTLLFSKNFVAGYYK